ncbi:hypothetical protein H5410_034842 [Solanum commersonii]|uniref:DCD domain-containing protein n=1 Tax=Solanum commersonii TaxID=4109 RepID=A0A9J5Y0W0_SOLCO|nr:hypothetical protein H5410_034842 [Solanum commersonii]
MVRGNNILVKLEVANHDEERWRQKSRALWLKEGDKTLGSFVRLATRHEVTNEENEWLRDHLRKHKCCKLSNSVMETKPPETCKVYPWVGCKFPIHHFLDEEFFGVNTKLPLSHKKKRFKTLPAAETLRKNEVHGGYIFVCNNDTMQEDLKRRSLASSFGGSNIDPTAWEDKKCKGESRFPAQVRF